MNVMHIYNIQRNPYACLVHICNRIVYSNIVCGCIYEWRICLYVRRMCICVSDTVYMNDVYVYTSDVCVYVSVILYIWMTYMSIRQTYMYDTVYINDIYVHVYVYTSEYVYVYVYTSNVYVYVCQWYCIYKWHVWLYIWMPYIAGISCVARVNSSRHIHVPYEWVMSHSCSIWISHVTFISHIWTSHVKKLRRMLYLMDHLHGWYQLCRWMWHAFTHS